MISEVVNALFLTILATEYLLQSSDVSSGRGRGDDSDDSSSRFFRTSSNKKALSLFACAFAVVVIVNVVDRISGATHFVSELLDGFLHLPKVAFVAFAYLFALYLDCRWNCSGGGATGATSTRSGSSSFRHGRFWKFVGTSFLYVLPVYPFLAVLISFGFLVVIRVFELLHLPLDVLNWPIYYGTLYGPFSFVYWKVKRQFVRDDADRTYNSLPTTATATATTTSSTTTTRRKIGSSTTPKW